MENLKKLIRIAKERQKIADNAILKAMAELTSLFDARSQKEYEEAEEAVLLYIYDGKDINDNSISLSDLIKQIRTIEKK